AALRRGHDAPELDAAFVAPAVALDGAAQSGHAGGLQRRSRSRVLGRSVTKLGRRPRLVAAVAQRRMAGALSEFLPPIWPRAASHCPHSGCLDGVEHNLRIA